MSFGLRTPRSLVAPLTIAVAYGVVAAVSLRLTQGADGIAAMWPASGVLLVGVLRLDLRRTALCLLAAAAASVAVNLDVGNPWSASLGFSLANMVETLVGSTLLRRARLTRPRFTNYRDIARFTLAALLSALVSTAIAVLSVDADLAFALSWFTTVMLGILLVGPLLTIGLDMIAARVRGGGEEAILGHSPATAVALLALVALTTAAVFAQDRYPLLFLPLIALLAATFRLGPFGAAAGIVLIALIAPLELGLDHGLGNLRTHDAREACYFLQFYLLTLFATSLPFGALLARQRGLAADLAQSERMHRLLAESSTDVILRLAPDGRALYCSPAVASVLGFTPEQVAGTRPMEAVHPDDRPSVEAAWARAVTSPTPETIVFRHARADGGHAWLDVAYRRVETETGHEVVCRARDITLHRAAEVAAEASQREVREANRLLGMAERAAQVGHWRLDLIADTLFWSPEVYRIHGIAIGQQPDLARALDLYHPDDRARVAALVTRSVEEGEPFEFEARIIRADGEIRHVDSRGQPEIGYDGRTTAMFGIVQDTSRRVDAEQALEAARAAAEAAAAHAMRLADTDALTGVASRRRALAALDEAIEAAERGGDPLALAIFDVDHFKSINDRFGHPAGDAVLRRVSRAAQHAVRPTDLVGRLGGEEFAVVLPGAGAEAALALADTLRRAIAASADGVGAGPPVTVSVGVATLVPGGSAAALLSEADRALYEAKNAGRNAARLAA